MERYSTLWGTDKAGVYGRRGASKRLSSFLVQKIGGDNVKDVVELTEKILSGIKTLPGYELETLANKPLAVTYAPLYLNKKPGMPKNMKPFCAMTVSGLEHRVGRKESAYSHTIFFAREDMLTAGDFNYLDLLMGTHLLTSQEVRSHRNGTYAINFEQQPKKVDPVLIKKDLIFACKAIEALYQKKNVVLVLEEGVNFNRRATEVLTQLYSMMQPMLATETGFATYQTQERILELSGETNVQIYVVPAGSELTAIPRSKFEILHLSAVQLTLERTPVTMTLAEWVKYDWQHRRMAMEHLFAKNNDYLNAELFVRLSKEFFAQAQALNMWYADTSRNKTISTIEELQAEDKTQTEWKLVPWAGELFERKYPALLKDKAVDVLNAHNVAAIYEYNGDDEELKRRSAGTSDKAAAAKAAQQYQYGRKLAGVNEVELSKLIWEKANSRLLPAYQGEIDGLNTQLRTQETRHSEETAALKTQHQTALTAAVAAEAAKTAAVQGQLDAEKEARTQEVAQLRSTHETQLKEAVEAEQAKTAEVQSKLDAADAVREQQLAELRTAADQAINDLKDKANQKLAAAREQLNQASMTIQGLDADLANKKQTITTLNAKLSEAAQNNDALNEQIARLENDVANKNATIRKQKSRINQLETASQSAADGNVPVFVEPPVIGGGTTVPGGNQGTEKEEITMLGMKLPKKALPLLAGAAAIGLILGMLLFWVVSLIVPGGPGTETTPPTTTEPVETTVPVETTIPKETTPPTTVPPTTLPPETAWLEDGQVNWDYLYRNVSWTGTVVTDPVDMEEYLGENLIAAEGWETEAVLLPSNWSIGEDGLVPAYITVLRAEEAQESEAGAEDEAPADDATVLLDSGRLVVDNGVRAIVVCFNYGDEYQFKRNSAIDAALDIAALLGEEGGALKTFSYMLEDGRAVDLQLMMTEAGMASDWWTELDKISLKEQDLTDMSFILDTERATVTKIVMKDGTEGCILDYAGNKSKGEKMVKLSEDKGRNACYVSPFVLVLLNESGAA